MDWKLLSSRIVFDKFMQIEERSYKLPDGQTKNFYIKKNQPAVCVLALTKTHDVITVKQFRPGPQTILHELPGGYMEAGETPSKAAARELLEETGYAGKLKFITECFDDAYTTMNRSCFVATDCEPVGEQQLDSGEFIDVELLSLTAFLEIVRSGQMTDVEVAFLGLDYLGLLGNPGSVKS